MVASSNAYELEVLIGLIIMCIIGIPICYNSMIKYKNEGKKGESFMFGFAIVGGIFLMIVLLLSGYEKFIVK